ncbi:gas vesicle protein GvpG [Synechococcus sp. Nb3U1]|uniref:gas vesicle protein GvpG n=1 Tax=Synechococcus sp. Nb3U1 TaxID=1914529 RepID=UPI001F48711B|nr:gas vesicle protein GvpG [Synechococcus sp. Nb3U1]MCF2970150.1 gas vesicle protein GvpG [Synechococcus sp. Nb3U1]
MVWQLLTWPAQSLFWLAGQIQERAEAQLDNKENLQKELTALQIQLDLGEIDEAAYTEREEEILLALEALAEAERQAEAETEPEDAEDEPETDP